MAILWTFPRLGYPKSVDELLPSLNRSFQGLEVAFHQFATRTLGNINDDLGEIVAGQIHNSDDTAGILISGTVPGTWIQYIDISQTNKLLFRGQIDIQNPTLSQGSLSYHLVLRDEDVAHGMTAVAETDVLGLVGPDSALAGGMQFIGLRDTSGTALGLQGYAAAGSASSEVMQFLVGKKSGTGTTPLAATDVAYRFWNGGSAPGELLTILGSGETSVRRESDGRLLHLRRSTGTNNPSLGISVVDTGGIVRFDGTPISAGAGEFRWMLNSADELALTTAALTPATAGGLTLGTASLPWGSLITSGPFAFGSVASVTRIQRSSAEVISFLGESNANATLQVGHILAGADNTYDIGTSGANRPKDLYLAGTATVGGTLSVVGSLRGAGIGSFGSTLSATGYSRGDTLRLTDGVSAPATVAGVAQLYVASADGDLKVKFGDGFVATIAADA